MTNQGQIKYQEKKSFHKTKTTNNVLLILIVFALEIIGSIFDCF
jgi:hypothetical protein